ncbi:hypothetical protein ACIRU3_46575 [Streptomyces sp. NPDC101151]|uniref:hypothetical protein n=1 Tax=Streptomyces sp. NPDC101151 TaxID=3366115 RepID=UPI0037FF04F4
MMVVEATTKDPSAPERAISSAERLNPRIDGPGLRVGRLIVQPAFLRGHQDQALGAEGRHDLVGDPFGHVRVCTLTGVIDDHGRGIK